MKTKHFLFSLLAVDVIFILLHFGSQMTNKLTHIMFAVTRDRNIPEFYQYAKEIIIVGMLIILFFRYKQKVFLFLSFLFGFLFIDDAFQTHEAGGRLFAHVMSSQRFLGLRSNDFGEVIIWSFFAIIFLLCLLSPYCKTILFYQRIVIAYMKWLVLLTFFAGGVDMAHTLFHKISWNQLLGVVEDGGEMIVMSFITWYTYCILKKDIGHELAK